MPHRIRRISAQIFLAQLAILTVSMAVGFGLFAQTTRTKLDQDYEARAAAIALAFSTIPTIRSCMAADQPGCASFIQQQAMTTAHATGAAYVVVIGLDRVRHSHPDVALIGQQVEEPVVAVDGKVHLGTDVGETGVNANARVPLPAPDGHIVGEVSVGIRESSVTADMLERLPLYIVWGAVAIGVGALGSLAVARRMKRRTFGLELDEIALLLQEREATLHGIREGVIAIDPDGRISVLNDEARGLLHLRPDSVGRRLEEVLPEGHLRSVLTGATASEDEIVVTEDLCLVVNRMPVILGARPHGAVVTLRNRTEVEGLIRELAGERSMTDSMRAQHHEFANRLHVVAGLLELGRPDEALRYVTAIRSTAADLDLALRSHIAAPQIVGLMLGKVAEANERGIDLTLDPLSRLGPAPEGLQALTTVLGNLIDNAFDAVAAVPAPRRVEVSLVEDDQDLTVTVSDNGPGIPPGATQLIFHDGYTTKRAMAAGHSGLGLALVKTTVARLGGTVAVADGPGASFTVVIPRVARPLAAVAP
jgi:two-component system CitB family sensor kinase